MPRIYDNIDQHLAPALRTALENARSADFCVGYFNLRGWRVLGDAVETLTPSEAPCRLLIGMHRPPQELRRALHGAGTADEPIDQQRAFAHVLRTFPVVSEPVREAARNAYRAVARGDVS